MIRMMTARSGIGLWALAAAMAVVPAHAQAAGDGSSSDAKPTAEIVVTGQQATKQVRSDGDLGALGQVDAMSTPFNITSYTARLILDQQAQTIGDVMKNDPAVRVTNGYANSSQQFVIRGFPLNGDDVAMDGLYGVTPRQLVSPELYDSVQVLNGASAFLFGAAPGGSGIGGGINLIPKRATENSFIRLTGTYTGSSIFGGNVDASTRFGPDKDFGVRANFVYRDGTGEIEHEKHGVTVGGLSFDWRHGAGKLTVDLGYELQKANWVEPETFVGLGASVPKPPKNDYNYGQPWTYTHLRDLYGIVREEVEIAKDTSIFAAFGFRQGREKGNYSAITVSDAATGAGSAYGFPVAFNQDAYAGQVGLRSAFEVAGITNKLNVGASINWSEKRVAYIYETPYATNLYDRPIAEEPTEVFGGGDFNHPTKTGDTELGSVYASDTIGLFNDRVLVIGGARYQNMQINGYDYNTTQRNAHYNEHAVTPVVGVVVRPTSYLSLYANRIEGLSQGPEAPASGVSNPGEIFPPYRSVQYEVGAKFSVAMLTATAALYQIKQPSAYTAENGGVMTFVENGEQRNRGFELSVNGEASRYIRFIGGLTLNRAKLVNTGNGAQDGNYAIGVPKTQINFGVEVVPPFFDKLTVTGRVIHTSSQFVDVDNKLSIPTWTTYELGARYIIVTDSHPITLRATVDNITNKSYWQSSFGGYLLPGIPRTARLSATVEF